METKKLAHELRELMYMMGKNKPLKCEGNSNLKKHDLMFLQSISKMNAGGNVKMSDIANHFCISPPATSQLIRKFEAKGYIERTILENDRRSVYIKLTDEVKVQIQQAEKRINEDITNLIVYLGEDDAIEMIRLLKKASMFMNEYDRDRRE